MKISSHAKIWKNCAWNELGSEASKLVNCRRPESDSKQLINTFQSGVIKLANIMKIAFIHSEKKLGTGAHYINDLMSEKLKQYGIQVKNFYPKAVLLESDIHLKGINNILFFYSLIEYKKEILKFSLIQGTTYTPLPFIATPIPTVSHFGSTTHGFLKSVPKANKIRKTTRNIWYALRDANIIPELNIKTRHPMMDIAEIELHVAKNATAVIATSDKVKQNLIDLGVPKRKITVIYNAIEDYWFDKALPPIIDKPKLVFLGRLGGDAFTLKLKGADRLIHLFKKFPKMKKTSICMTGNKNLKEWLKKEIPNHYMFVNLKKDLIPNVLRPIRGSILFIPSRYEGFSLSLIEGMSCGLIPITYPVGVAPEIIRNGRNGFIVRSQTEAVRCVKKLIANNELREMMSQRAR